MKKPWSYNTKIVGFIFIIRNPNTDPRFLDQVPTLTAGGSLEQRQSTQSQAPELFQGGERSGKGKGLHDGLWGVASGI